MTEEQLNQKAENEGASFSDQYAGDFYAKQYTFIGYSKGYKAGFSAGVESAQPDWRYLPELPEEGDGIVQVATQITAIVRNDGTEEAINATAFAFQLSGHWYDYATGDKYYNDDVVYAWRKIPRDTPPLPPAKNQ